MTAGGIRPEESSVARPPRQTTSSYVRARELPRLFFGSLRLVWDAGPRELVLVVGLQLVSALGMAAQLFATRAVFATVLRERGGSVFHALLPLLLFGSITVAVDVARAIENERGRLLGELVAKHTIARVIDRSLAVSLAAFEDAGFHDRLQRAQNQSTLRAMQTVTGILGLASGAIASIGVIGALAGLQPLLVPLLAAGLVPLWVSSSRNSRDYYRFSFELTSNDRRRLYLQYLMLNRDPAKEIRVFQLGPYLKSRHQELYRERIDRLRRLARKRAIRSVAASLASTCLLAAGVAVLASLYISGRMSLAVTGASLFGLYQLTGRLQVMHFGASALYESTLFVRDYAAFIHEDGIAPTGPISLPGPLQLLEVRAVDYTYPNASARSLHDVSLHIASGEVVALVGENGSGKTTLAKLIAALYEPQRGQVYWNGLDSREVEADALRREIAVVFQDFERYLLTVCENIGFGCVDQLDNRTRLSASAEHAGALSFITRLPQGLDTELGKQWSQGSELSTGQWQRLALARAFFRNASLVVFDEPTAALDARAEAELFDRMRDLLEGRAALLISHRFSSVRTADRIYVLERGRIIDQGTHDELMDRGGTYAELFLLQAAQYLDAQPALKQSLHSVPR